MSTHNDEPVMDRLDNIADRLEHLLEKLEAEAARHFYNEEDALDDEQR